MKYPISRRDFVPELPRLPADRSSVRPVPRA